MLTAVDSNVVSAYWSNEPAAVGMRALLFEARQAGGLVLCAPGYAELLAYPGATPTFVNTFLADTNLQVVFELPERVWLRAGEAFAGYAARRRKDKVGHPKRLLVDFVVGAHALTMADRLMTLDPKRYRTSYPNLALMTGESSP